MAAAEWETLTLGEVLERASRPVPLQADEEYTTLGVRLYGEGVFKKAPQLGSMIAAKILYAVTPEDILYSRLFAWKGSFGVAMAEHDGCVVSGEFPTFRARKRLLPSYFALWAARPEVWNSASSASTGTTAGSRNRLKEQDFLALEIQLPPLDEQKEIVEAVGAGASVAAAMEREAKAARALAAALYGEAAERDAESVPLRDVGQVEIEVVTVEPDAEFPMAGVVIAGRGLFWRDAVRGSDTGYPRLHRLRRDQLVYRKLTAWEGPITVVAAEFEGAFVSPEFPTITLDESRLLPEFMRFVCRQPWFHGEMRARATGTAERRNRLKPGDLLEIELLLPPPDTQRQIAAASEAAEALDRGAKAARRVAAATRDTLLSRAEAPLSG